MKIGVSEASKYEGFFFQLELLKILLMCAGRGLMFKRQEVIL
jgi:hypothetical protein